MIFLIPLARCTREIKYQKWFAKLQPSQRSFLIMSYIESGVCEHIHKPRVTVQPLTSLRWSPKETAAPREAPGRSIITNSDINQETLVAPREYHGRAAASRRHLSSYKSSRSRSSSNRSSSSSSKRSKGPGHRKTDVSFRTFGEEVMTFQEVIAAADAGAPSSSAKKTQIQTRL